VAKKSKGFSELLHEQRQVQKDEQKALKKLQQKVQSEGGIGASGKLVMNPKGLEKMSDVVEAFLEPYMHDVHTRQDYEKLLMLATMAWNTSFLPEDKHQSALYRFVEESHPSHDLSFQKDIKDLLEAMIARKKEFFADNVRKIINFQLEDMHGSWHLSIASTLPPQGWNRK
jgi:hypothetical protein